MKERFVIRKPARDEFAGIVACFSEKRGRRYLNPKYYDEKYIFGEECELIAAYAEDGTMAGVMGLSRPPFQDERSLMGLLHVRPAFEGKGLAKALIAHEVEFLCGASARSIKGHVVTKHDSVQRMVEEFGLRPAAFFHGMRDGMNAAPPALEKDTLALYVRAVSCQDVGTLYLHRDIVAFAKGIYEELAVKMTVETLDRMAEEIATAEETVLTHCFDAHDSVLMVQVLVAGADLPGLLAGLTAKYRSVSQATTLVFLNLCHKAAIYGCETLKEKGYRFCGIDPLGQYKYAIYYLGDAALGEMKMTGRLTACYEKTQTS